MRLAVPRWLRRNTPATEPVPVVLSQGRIYVLPTRAGLAFAAALLVMLIASINYHLSLGYGLVFLLGGIAVASAVHAFRNLLQLSISPGRVEAVFAGEPAQFRLVVTNPRRIGRAALRARLDSHTEHFSLAPGAGREIVLPRASRRRGWLDVGRLTLETTYPLGLFRAWSVLRPDCRALIYPAPEAVGVPMSRGSGSGEGHGASAYGQDDFAGLRAHRPADSPRHVAWKSVAGGRPLMTKQFSGQAGGTLMLNWFAQPDGVDADSRAARLAGQVLASEAQGLRYALRTPGAVLPAGRGPAHVRACLAELALTENEDVSH